MTYASNEVLSNFLTRELKYRVAKPTQLVNTLAKHDLKVVKTPYLDICDDLGKSFLRDWQKKALESLLMRLENNIEVTSAHQGTGKTIYSAASFILYALQDPKVINQDFATSRKQIIQTDVLDNYFPIVVVPARSILHNTIKAWRNFGINLKKLENPVLKYARLEDLKHHGINGLLLSYAQISKGFRSDNGYWVHSPLVSFVQRELNNKKIFVVLDECHEMTIRDNGTCNGKAAFFIDNYKLFTKLHLMSGSLGKGGCKAIQRKTNPRIPFVKYSQEGEALPDTYYSQDDAIQEGVIVKTKVIYHPIVYGSVEVNGKLLEFKGSEDLEWFCQNYSENSIKFSNTKNYAELNRIKDAFNAIYKSKEIWQSLLVFGEQHLRELKQEFVDGKGIIFAPSIEAAVKIHSDILKNRSVLCVSNVPNDLKNENIINVKSENLSKWLDQNDTKIDWIVSCETLKQGFDYPKCKVQILIPRLEFLDIIKVSQMIGRTNRSIAGKDIKAVCITIENPPVQELIKYSLDSKFGICELLDNTNNIINSFTNDVWEKAVERTRLSEIDQELEKDIIDIKELVISDIGTEQINESQGFLNTNQIEKQLVSTQINNLHEQYLWAGTFKQELVSTKPDDQYQKSVYGSKIRKELTPVQILSYWKYWADIVYYGTHYSDLKEEELPPENWGVYIVVNSKTCEVVYIGGSDNLRHRIKELKRFRMAKWKHVEGEENLFVKWFVIKNWNIEEEKLKKELNPKYDNEKHAKY